MRGFEPRVADFAFPDSPSSPQGEISPASYARRQEEAVSYFRGAKAANEKLHAYRQEKAKRMRSAEPGGARLEMSAFGSARR